MNHIHPDQIDSIDFEIDRVIEQGPHAVRRLMYAALNRNTELSDKIKKVKEEIEKAQTEIKKNKKVLEKSKEELEKRKEVLEKSKDELEKSKEELETSNKLHNEFESFKK